MYSPAEVARRYVETGKSKAVLPVGRMLLLGMLADKDVQGVLEAVTPLAEAVVTVAPPSPRALSAEALRQLLPHTLPSRACHTMEEAVRTAAAAAGPQGAVCALGSLYMVGAVRRAVQALS